MQISDLLGQYSRNVANGTEELKGAQSVQKLVSTLKELSAGSIFEGTVASIRNGKAVLSLGNGQTILARLDGKAQVQQGVSMFFQVKSNDGSTLAIRPYTGMGNVKNPILLNALTTAGIPVNDKTMELVESMMKEQMPVGKNSLLDMARLLSAHPGVEPSTIVKMVKYGIPVNREMAAQFENYAMDRHAILKEMDSAIGQIASSLGGSELSAEESFSLYGKIVDILQGNGERYAASGYGPNGNGELLGNAENGLQGNAAVRNQESMLLRETAASDVVKFTFGQIGEEEPLAQAPRQTENGVTQQDARAQELPAQTNGAAEGRAQAVTVGQVLGEAQLARLARLLEGVPVLAGNDKLFPAAREEFFINTLEEELPAETNPNEGEAAEAAEARTQDNALDREMPVQKFLSTVKQIFEENSQYGFSGIKKLFSSKEFGAALRSAFEEQWTIKPQELKQENKISQLYEKLTRQMAQAENVMKAAGLLSESFTQTANDIRSNIDFMNQINQVYAYMQLPLKMAGQNANGELYVYTNKKLLRDKNAEVSAFLHLDLEHLGSTDVSVKMLHKNVQTKFYLADDAAFHLVEKHIPVLERRLKNKGYHCTITLSNEEKKVNLVEDFLTQEKPSAGAVHRYSFDVKA